MAYPAVNSLIQTLELFRTTYPVLVHGQTAEIIESLRASAEYFQNILENSSQLKHEHEMIKNMEGDMRAAVQQAEDVLESNVAIIMREQWTIQDETEVLIRDLSQAKDKIDVVSKDLAQVSKDLAQGFNAYGTAGGDSFRKRASTALLQDVIVGMDDALMKITDRILGPASEREVIPILGMGGCGKTTLAGKVMNDPSIISRFAIHAWVTISQEYHLRQVLLNLVCCITGKEFQEFSDDQLMDKAYKALKGRKYLIVIDDIWCTKIWDLIARTLPDDKNGSRIILTTRLKDVAEYVNPEIPSHEMMALSKDESLKLLCIKLFGAEYNCPSELEEIGKKIVVKCQGLPLAILVVAGHLSKIPMTEERWATVAQDVSKVVNSNPDECLAILAMSYHHLPIHLKPCFLHLGTFPEDYKIDMRRLIRYWVAEGFLKSDKLKSPEHVAEDCLEDLVSRNLIMARRTKLSGRIKSCAMHDLLRDLSVMEAAKEKFSHVIRIDPAPNVPVKNHETTRFSLHSCISLKKISNSSQDVRSLYLFQEPHEPTGKTLEFKTLRVLAANPWSHFTFRHHMTLNSAILRYLEVITDNHFTEFLPYMYNLQTFINHRVGYHVNSTLPIHIWDMKQLRHFHISDCFYLPNPQSISRIDVDDRNSVLGLQHLQELFGLFIASCTKEVFSYLPNLKKLSIHETRTNTDVFEETSGSLLNLVYLNKLESLKCHFSQKRPLSCPLTDWCSFPMSLRRLTLNGSCLPWEDMATLAKLPKLEVLKLINNAFRGKVWKLNNAEQFNQLQFLLVGEADLVKWEVGSLNFPNLRRLLLTKCLHLEQIPPGIGEICSLESIELYECSSTAVQSAREIQQEVAKIAGSDCLDVQCYRFDHDVVSWGLDLLDLKFG